MTEIFTFFLLIFLSSPVQATDLSTVSLAMGEQKSFPIEPGTRFSIGNPEVISVKFTQVAPGNSILLVKGKAQGYSDLLLLGDNASNKSLAFRVFTKKQIAVTRDSEKLLDTPSGLSVRPQGESWVVKGEAKTVEDLNVVRVMESQSKGKVQSLVRIHPLQRLHAEEEIRRRLRMMGLGDLSVVGVGTLILLKGEVASAQEKELAEQLAKEVFRDVRSHLKVPFESGERLRFHAKILELNHSEGEALGLEWPTEFPGALQISTKSMKAALGLDATLRLMERRGQARVLSRPVLLLNEKGVAELKVGGEIPIPLKTKYHSEMQWKNYGLLLRLELPGVSRQRARAKITVEITTLDPANGNEGIPALRTSHMETVVDLKIGAPVLLSGLMESRQSRNLSMLPFVGDIPILGELFRSRDFQESKSELAIFLEARP